MVKALFDTNILIDYLNGIKPAGDELIRYQDVAISIVSWMEVLAGAPPAFESDTRRFLTRFDLVGIDERIADRAVSLRRTHRIKLPDAIIWASALVESRLLVTRNERDFPADDPGVRIPYRL